MSPRADTSINFLEYSSSLKLQQAGGGFFFFFSKTKSHSVTQGGVQ